MIDTCLYSPEPEFAAFGGGAGAGTPVTRTQAEREIAPAQAAVATGTRVRIALAHDWLVGYRGGEAVLEHIARVVHRHYEVAGLYTMFEDAGAMELFPTPPTGDRGVRHIATVRTSFLSDAPGARRMRRWMLPMYPHAIEHLSNQLAADHRRRPIDLLLSTSSAAIKGLKAPEGVPHICYCHSPARYLWSQAEQYAEGSGGGLRAIGLQTFGPRLRSWDKTTSENVSVFLANSTHIQREISRCYERESLVVFPPVDTRYFTLPTGYERPILPHAAVEGLPDAPTLQEMFYPPTPHAHGEVGAPPASQRSGWLFAGALEPYKRADLAVRAATLRGERLCVIGTGSQEKHLRSLAEQLAIEPGQVRLIGHAPREEVRRAFQTSRVLVFPQTEDFGIVAVEAQACGLPVVAYRDGGALDTVIEGETGVFFDEQTPEAIGAAVERCLALGDIGPACRANAERFGVARFEEEIGEVIERALSG